MSRTMPTECPHGAILDWGDFGGEDSTPEPCRYCRSRGRKNDLRDLVFRYIVREAKRDAKPNVSPQLSLRDAINTIGIFHLMDVVDLIVDGVEDAYDNGTPLSEVCKETPS